MVSTWHSRRRNISALNGSECPPASSLKYLHHGSWNRSIGDICSNSWDFLHYLLCREHERIVPRARLESVSTSGELPSFSVRSCVDDFSLIRFHAPKSTELLNSLWHCVNTVVYFIDCFCLDESHSPENEVGSNKFHSHRIIIEGRWTKLKLFLNSYNHFVFIAIKNLYHYRAIVYKPSLFLFQNIEHLDFSPLINDILPALILPLFFTRHSL